MGLVYYPGCSESELTRKCLACGIDPEKARVRSAGYIHRTAYAEILADPDNATLWQTHIASKKIIIIDKVIGSYDGGNEITAPGYGDQAERIVGFNNSMSFKDPAYEENGSFYDTLMKYQSYHAVWVSESKMHISKKPVQVIPKNPITENLTDDVVWDVTNKWQQIGISVPYDIPEGIFECFDFVP